MTHVLVGGKKRDEVLAEERRRLLEKQRAIQEESPGVADDGTVRLADLLFTELSKKDASWPDAVTHCAQTINGLDYVLWSAQEAARYRLGKKDPNAEQYLLTRTAVLYFVENGKKYAAFDDSPHPRENIILARAQEGYDSHKKNNTWFVPKNDLLVSGALARATSSKRIIKVKANSAVWKYSIVPGPAGSAFGKAKVNHMIFGADVAEPYASWIHHQDSQDPAYQQGIDWLLHGTEVAEMNLPSDMVEVRAVALGGGDYDSIRSVVAYRQLNDGGLAAGVASTQNDLQWK